MNPHWVPAVALFILISTCLFALIKGGESERYGTILIVAANIASDIAMSVSFPHIPQYVLFLLDFALAVGLLLVALCYTSLWLGAAMLLQSIALCAHAYVLGGDGPAPIQWMVLNNAISNLMLVCILVSTAMSWRKRRASTPDGSTSARLYSKVQLNI